LPSAPTLACSGAPEGSQCSVRANITGGTVTGATVTLQTTRRRSARLRNGDSSGTPAGHYELLVTAKVGAARRAVVIPVDIR
jgi:copper(I)-binding protein